MTRFAKTRVRVKTPGPSCVFDTQVFKTGLWNNSFGKPEKGCREKVLCGIISIHWEEIKCKLNLVTAWLCWPIAWKWQLGNRSWWSGQSTWSIVRKVTTQLGSSMITQSSPRMTAHALEEKQSGLLGQDGVGWTAGVAGHIFLDVTSQHTLYMLLLKATCIQNGQQHRFSQHSMNTETSYPWWWVDCYRRWHRQFPTRQTERPTDVWADDEACQDNLNVSN